MYDSTFDSNCFIYSGNLSCEIDINVLKDSLSLANILPRNFSQPGTYMYIQCTVLGSRILSVLMKGPQTWCIYTV